MGKVIFDDKWVAAIAPVLPSLYDEGANTVAVCKVLGMSHAQYYVVKGRSAQFKVAHEEGLLRAEAYWSNVGEQGIVGEKKINTIAWLFYMKCRFKWVDRQVITQETAHPEENTAPTLAPDEAKELLGQFRQANK